MSKCVVCSSTLFFSKNTNHSLRMFCSNKCLIEWNTKIHFVDVDWNVPTFSIQLNASNTIGKARNISSFKY